MQDDLCPKCGEKYVEVNHSGKCFHCEFWEEKLELSKTDKQQIVIQGHMFYIENELPKNSPMFRGFGGSVFYIRSISRPDEIIMTTNLWHNGKIPEKFFRERLPDTHEYTTRKEYEKCPNKLSY